MGVPKPKGGIPKEEPQASLLTIYGMKYIGSMLVGYVMGISIISLLPPCLSSWYNSYTIQS